MNTTANPLLDLTDLPRFDLIQPEHVKPAITQLLADGRALIERLTGEATPATWGDFAGALADGLEGFGRAWGIVGHLHSVNDVPVWREAYNEMLPEVSRFYTQLGQNLKLFDKYRALQADFGHFSGLTAEQQKVIRNEIRDFRLGGADLPEDQKPRFQAIMEELSQLSAKFSENLLDATNAFAETVTDEAQLAGLPDYAKDAAREVAQKAGVEGWKFTLHAPSYGPLMQYAENRELRARMYRAYATRAAEIDNGFSKPEWDNGPLMKRILELREEDAKMLGFANFAEVSLYSKMADTPQQVLSFLRDMARKAKPFAKKDMAELLAFAKDELGITDFQPWDAAYVSEKLLQARYAFSEQEVKQYFTEPKVIAGLFKVIESLFTVRVKEDSAPVWHEDVRFYRIETPAGDLVGQFYMDLYARETKRGGAWMDEARSRKRMASGIQKPIAYLNCNFARPVGGKPATFTHDEVITLFHEAGHGLHHLLTRGEELGVSGIHGVEWDAVELPSQFMENYCWEWAVLQDMTAHVDTGEPLPRTLYDKMLAAKNFQSGMMTVRQLEFSIFDMRLHCEFDPKSGLTVMDLIREVRDEVAVLIPPEWHRFPNSFSHIFGGGYAAGYYSYKWAEVLSADAYAAFEEAGNPFDATVGKRYLDEILSRGGSRPALENFKAFRGREPSVDALLRHSGMIAA
ncbi:M3 family metallopeptidase [Dechloromonas sp.]|uniref:M3 family metallopeptidase n=1 Tax=Dechloromonas sp. TaxID=1917218 RepID=UPI00263F8419|nr:M3 family metallopeptidase [Dechloromonas sp.]